MSSQSVDPAPLRRGTSRRTRIPSSELLFASWAFPILGISVGVGLAAVDVLQNSHFFPLAKAVQTVEGGRVFVHLFVWGALVAFAWSVITYLRNLVGLWRLEAIESSLITDFLEGETDLVPGELFEEVNHVVQ